MQNCVHQVLIISFAYSNASREGDRFFPDNVLPSEKHYLLHTSTSAYFSLAFSNTNFIAWLEHLQVYIAKTLFLDCPHSWSSSTHFTVTLEQCNTKLPPPQKYKKKEILNPLCFLINEHQDKIRLNSKQ